MKKIIRTTTIDGVYNIWCEGCQGIHTINTKEKNYNGAIWSFNGNFEKPTFSPSLFIKTGLYAGSKLVDENDLIEYPKGKEWNDFLKQTSTVCHSFITDGNIKFLSDSTHKLSGQTLPLIEMPE